MSLTINDINIVEMVFTNPICGRWVASISLNTTDAASFAIGTEVTIKNEEQEYIGHVSEYTGLFLATTRFKVLGGKKDIVKPIKPKSWNSNIPFSDPIKYILQDVGLQLSSTSSQAILNKRLPGWNIIKDDGDLVLKNLLNGIPDEVLWHVLPDSTIYVGEPTFTNSPTNIYYNIQNEHPELKQYDANVLGIGLQPGMIIKGYSSDIKITNIEFSVFDSDITANIIGA